MSLNDLERAQLKRVRAQVTAALSGADALVADLKSTGASEAAVAHAVAAQEGLQSTLRRLDGLADESTGVPCNSMQS